MLPYNTFAWDFMARIQRSYKLCKLRHHSKNIAEKNVKVLLSIATTLKKF